MVNVSKTFAQTQKRNVFEVDRTAPKRPRPKADDNTTQTLKQMMGRDFNSKMYGGNLYFFIVFFMLLFAAVVGLVYYDTNYRQNRSNLENPWLVFQELCKAHQLTRTERKFLKQLAQILQLDDPLPLFIEPKYLVGALENKNCAADRSSIEYFLRKLFDINPGEEKVFQTQIGISSVSVERDRHESEKEKINDSRVETIVYGKHQ